MARPTHVARLALAAWASFIALLAVLPFGTPSSHAPAVWVAVVPFDTVVHAVARGLTVATFVSVVGNVVAFVPVGLLAPVASSRWRGWTATLALGLCLSLAVETSQLAISIAVGVPYRRADVDDLLLNGAGTAIGYVAWRLGVTLLERAPARSG
jgi:glycopeptide antibiotics resistance protein